MTGSKPEQFTLEQAQAPLSPERAEARNSTLRELLGVDYLHAVESGLLERFYLAEDYDAVTHILGGDVRTLDNGRVVGSGFHHAPSAEYLWPRVMDDDGIARVATRTIDAEQQEKDFPADPYEAKIAINGIERQTFQFKRITDPETGEKKKIAGVFPRMNTMFPAMYDSYSILRMIVAAYDDRDMRKDDLHHIDVGNTGRYRATVAASLVDGVTKMPMKVVADYDTERIYTAMPIIREGDRFTGLSLEGAVKHAINGSGVERIVL